MKLQQSDNVIHNYNIIHVYLAVDFVLKDPRDKANERGTISKHMEE